MEKKYFKTSKIPRTVHEKKVQGLPLSFLRESMKLNLLPTCFESDMGLTR